MSAPERVVDLASRLLASWGIKGSRCRIQTDPAENTVAWEMTLISRGLCGLHPAAPEGPHRGRALRPTRNPNYLGEILIYASFAILSWHWLPSLVLGGWVCFLCSKHASKGPLACSSSSLCRLQGQNGNVVSINGAIVR
jgi:hypothetical protein